MKKIIFISGLIIMLAATQITFAQVARTSWSFGFGVDYPSFFSSDVRPAESNYGGFLSLQHNFFENVALRLQAGYSNLSGTLGSYGAMFNAPSSTKVNTGIITGDLDFLYYITPCSVVDPYIAFGAGINSFKPYWDGYTNQNPNAVSKTSMELNIIFGSEWRISDSWNLKTELGLHSTDSQLDGIINNNRKGIFGSNSDSYFTGGVGLQYYFSKGEPSKYCDLYNGIQVQAPQQNYPTLAQIEAVIKKHIPKEVVKKVEVKIPSVSAERNWVLFGVNFNFGKTTLTPEAYPILQNALRILGENPHMKIEIQGYTDNIGSASYNQKISLERANTVKRYLTINGIAPSRIKTIGYGEKDPIGDNNTAVGRALNRRIEFKVLK